MDNSQTSEVLSNNGGYPWDTSTNSMDTDSYERLVSNTKLVLSKTIQTEVHKATFSTHFCTVLNDCSTCISQSLDLVMDSLSEPDINMSQLCVYLEDGISILHQLSSFITSVVECTTMSCCNMKVFPTTTGRIIVTVFTHCKESESLYGSHLSCVERQLKDLFRTCHELQLTYLMVLEKHFVFSMTASEELSVLVEALDINLKIGELAQSLDVKTMAEQWKAYTLICEKYSDFLMNTLIYKNSIEILCKIIENNIKTAVENSQEEKVLLRSLKIANFEIKILLRVCNIFKQANEKNYEHIIDLLLFVYQNNCSYLQTDAANSPQFVNTMNTNVTSPCEALLKDLLLDEKFVHTMSSIDLERLEKDDSALSYILVIITAMKLAIQKTTKPIKSQLLDCVFRWMPYGHIWFNMGLKFETLAEDTDQSFGLFEYLLTNTLALASTLDSEEMVILERKIYDTLLSTDSYGAMFSSSLWELLARLSPRPYVLNQVRALCKTYQSLKSHKLFLSSPQTIQLSHTIARLFETLCPEDKHRIYTLLSVDNENYTSLWSVIQIRNLPIDLLNQAEELITEKLKMKFHKVFTSGVQSDEEMDGLIQLMKLAASCSYSDYTDRLEDCVVTAWLRACPNGNKFLLSRDMDKDCTWYLEYIEALINLTILMKYVLQNSANFVQVFHVISSMIEKGVAELKLSLINLVCKMSLLEIQGDSKTFAESLLLQTFKRLIQDPHNIIRSKFYAEIRKHRTNRNVGNIISRILNEDQSFKATWNNLNKHGMLNSAVDLKTQLTAANKLEYTHKCIENQMYVELSDSQSVSVISASEKGNSCNFEFADIDSLFGADGEEPACKRVKFNTNDANEILTRLENDAALLCRVKENVFPRELRDRIRNVCEKLISVIE